MKILKKFLKVIGWIVGVLLVLAVVLLAPIDRYDYHEEEFYQLMGKELDTLKRSSQEDHHKGFSVGYSKVNLTPTQRTSLAGYGNRKGKFSGIHDSIFVRTLVVSNGETRAAIVSADLLIIPPEVNKLLEQELNEVGFSADNTYLGATHTHNSIGNWANGVTQFLYGSYQDSIVRFITDQIKLSIKLADQNSLPSQIKAGEFNVNNLLFNRVTDDGGLDSLVHVVEVNRSDSSKLLLMSFTAHPTCIEIDDMALSRDYPGVLVDSLEHNGYNFAMFMAGAVGSHAGATPQRGWTCTSFISEKLVDRFKKERSKLTLLSDTTLSMYRVPLQLGNPQVKIAKDWKVRPWVFKSAFGEFPVYLTSLRIGNLIMLGTPCDYSGELMPPLYEAGKKRGIHVMVTSFNGGYIGYVTPDKYYDVDHYETRLMNWYGPGSGSYLSESLQQLLVTTME